MTVFTPGEGVPCGGGEVTSYRELTSGGLISYQGNQQRGTSLTAPLIRTITSWGLGQVPRKVSQVSKIQEKQALVRQGMYREQENSHLEWPDHTLGGGSGFVKTRGVLSVLYLWYLVAVPLYIPDPRDMVEEQWTKVVSVLQGM